MFKKGNIIKYKHRYGIVVNSKPKSNSNPERIWVTYLDEPMFYGWPIKGKELTDVTLIIEGHEDLVNQIRGSLTPSELVKRYDRKDGMDNEYALSMLNSIGVRFHDDLTAYDLENIYKWWEPYIILVIEIRDIELCDMWLEKHGIDNFGVIQHIDGIKEKTRLFIKEAFGGEES